MTDEQKIKEISQTAEVSAAIDTSATSVEQTSVAETASSAAADPSAPPAAEVRSEKDKIIATEVKADSTSVLAQAAEAVKEEIKPAEKTEAEQKNESNLTDEPAPLPEYEPFTLPEGWTLDDTKLGEFNKSLAEFEVKNKADHAEVQAFGQKMIERYVSEIKRMQETNDQEVAKIRSGWKEAFVKDPELGGNRMETTKKVLMEAIQGYAGSPEHVESFGKFVEETGIGDNPDLARLIVNQQKAIQNYKAKYESEADIKILAGTKPEIVSEKVWHKLYGNSATN